MPDASGNKRSLSSNAVTIVQHNDPKEFLHAALPIFLRKEYSPMIILAHALKVAGVDLASESAYEELTRVRYTPTPSNPVRREAFWLTVWPQASPDEPFVPDLIVMCDSWALGDYPIFLWTPHEGDTQFSSHLGGEMAQLVDFITKCVDVERVFAVFGPAEVARSFQNWWSKATQVASKPKPYYDAYLTYSTNAPLSEARLQVQPPSGHLIRPAVASDIGAVAKLCHGFAKESVYPLSESRANDEARGLIHSREIWVYEVHNKVVSICAATRHSKNATVISKVFTDEQERRNGYAEHLVRHVTQRIHAKGKALVVLYVGKKNDAAKRVYDKVGFVGLGMAARSEADGCEHWLELGFETKRKGHW